MALSTHSTPHLELLESHLGDAESITVLDWREGHGIYGTRLAAAAWAGHFDQVHQLLAAGADPSARSRTECSGPPVGESVLELALRAGHCAVALLVAAAIDPKWRRWALPIFPARPQSLGNVAALHRAALCSSGGTTTPSALRCREQRRYESLNQVALALAHGGTPPPQALHVCDAGQGLRVRVGRGPAEASAAAASAAAAAGGQG